jgi:hexosaminidase
MAATIVTLPANAGGQTDRPATVPALAQWHGSGGAFELRDDTRVVVRRDDRVGLRREAKLLADDLSALVGRRIAVAARRHASARRGDVVVRGARGRLLGRHGTESYALRIGDSLAILAGSRTGAFYGGSTLLQLIRRAPLRWIGRSLA